MSVIVIIDDRVTNRFILAKLANSVEDNATVHTFADPGEALEWFADNTPDLVITDFMMPAMNGAEFTQRFRKQPLCFDVPVIVVTVYQDREFRYRALEAGATDFLLSPFDHHEFRVRVRNLLTLRKQQQIIKHRAYSVALKLEDSNRLHGEELRESDEKLRRVINTVPAMISATDSAGGYVFINNYQGAFFGIDPDEAVSESVFEMLGQEHGERHRALDQALFDTGKTPSSFEETFVDPDGQSRVFLTTKVPLRESTGGVANVVTVSLDITGRKRADKMLANQKNFLRAIIDSSPNLVYTNDRNGRITLANKTVADLFGTTAELLIGRRIVEFAADKEEVER